MSLKDKEKWDAKYRGSEYITGKDPSEWLIENQELLSGKGWALDIASGEGRNTVFAASLGYDAVGIDISEEGAEKARALARDKKTNIKIIVANLDEYNIEKNAFDLILCFNFLERRLYPAIRNGLKPGGLIFYETFTVDYLKYSNFKKEWVLDYNELLREFSEFRILRYREVDRDEKAFASLVAFKPS